jgi:hypothetical protein
MLTCFTAAEVLPIDFCFFFPSSYCFLLLLPLCSSFVFFRLSRGSVNPEVESLRGFPVDSLFLPPSISLAFRIERAREFGSRGP